MDEYSLAFSLSNLGPKKYQNLLLKFKSPKDAWKGQKQEFEEIGIKSITFSKFDQFRKTFNIASYLQKIEKEKVIFISFIDELYPEKLKLIENPPIGLFIKGNEKLLKVSLKIGVVGTRKITEYGKDVTEMLVTSLVQNNVCIVSGLALGVDGKAHRTALMNNGKTIAVLACGVNCCTPSENYDLYSEILKNNGLIISEYPLFQPPNKGTFLARNRIVAALSDGVLITEAASGSGSLVTAEYALKYGKKVFAVPGPINSKMSEGSTSLLKKGAKLVTEAEDILSELSITKKISSNIRKNKYKNLNKDEMSIVKLLDNEKMSVDEIAKKLKLPVSQLFISLSNLELKGFIKNNRGKFQCN